MPYNEHSLFTSPKDPDYKLWRYMDFTKFVSLLSKKTLFFPQARLLKQIDKWEGVWLQKELDHIYNWYKNFSIKQGDNNPIARANEFAIGQTKAYESSLNENFISCWHLNKVESAAMWRLYVRSNEGIVIKTNVERFKECFKDYKKPVFIGMVRYKDYFKDIYYEEGDKIPGGWNLFLPFIHKRNNFEYEHEYRAIICKTDNSTYGEETPDGLFVPVNIETLIDTIYISPKAPDWFLSLVKDTLEQFDIDKPVFRSEMDDETCKFKN